MWKLSQPEVEKVGEQLSAALTLLDGEPVYAISEDERDAVLAVYETYEQMSGLPGPELLPLDLSNDCSAAIEAAYSQVQKGGRLFELRNSLLLSTEICPFCGFGEVRELDHYLPKSTYKCLSIYPRNLVPACSACNNAKRTHVPTQGGQGFLHPYYADLPATNFFVASVSQLASALRVSFSIDPTHLDPLLAVSLDFQLNRLRLNERYRNQINGFLFGQKTSLLESFYAGGTPLLSYFLDASASALAADFGRNDWRPALFRGLASCEDFINGGVIQYFENRIPVGA